MRKQAQRAIRLFDQRTQAFHPVAIVGIHQPIALQQCGAMDVTADDAVQAASARVVQAEQAIVRAEQASRMGLP